MAEADRASTVGIIQARMSSRRLPGKVLADIAGRPALHRLVDRLLPSQTVGSWWIATSADTSDNPIAAAAQDAGIRCYRGDLDDVLSRFHACARQAQASTVVRITADCPFQEARVVDDVVRFFEGRSYDYVSNALDPKLPDGLDAEVFTMDALEKANAEARRPSDREHVTPFLHRHPERFRIGSWTASEDLAHHRWTLDEPADLAFVRAVYGALGGDGLFSMQDVLDLLDERPDIARLNAHIRRNEGYERSRKADGEDP